MVGMIRMSQLLLLVVIPAMPPMQPLVVKIIRTARRQQQQQLAPSLGSIPPPFLRTRVRSASSNEIGGRGNEICVGSLCRGDELRADIYVIYAGAFRWIEGDESS